ncbi:O-methyltransferase-domain-containing protein [Bombardia bombarda]|uniref:O-methyltransferase-domain-containing protein n=1 Tax=Bombardia bombarda TaxID=252184 RepID=A0AA39X8N5_9PEZI|nr:O-methyltransferase-domain-containing protein [Bombardia bombarda]
MTALANEISHKTQIITEYLSSRGLEAASFDVNGLAKFPIPPQDQIPFRARLELASAAKELYDISVGPKQDLRDLAWDRHRLVHEGLTAKVEAMNGNLPIGVLNLRRLLRHAMTNRIFCEKTKNQVGHTRVSRLLLKDEPLRNWAGFVCNDMWLPIANTVEAMKQWPGSDEPTETGVNLAYKHNLPWFDFIHQDQTLANRYNQAMKAHGGTSGSSVEDVVNGYPWANLGEATVVDMGGNQGYISMTIAEAHPALNFIAQDQAGMRTPETIGTVPDHLANRVQLTTHGFFTPQREVADCYFFLRAILHGFSDKYCVKILQALVPALRKGSVVVVNDGALPELGTASYVEERAMRTLDLMMQVTVNAHEREADDWTDLFARADNRYHVERVWTPERSVMSFVEVVWTGED